MASVTLSARGSERLDQQDPAAAAGGDQPQLRVAVAVLGEERLELGLERRAVERQVDRRRRAAEPVEVGLERERAAAVEPDHLEHAVAAVEPVVGQWEDRVGGGRDAARRRLPAPLQARRRGYRTGACPRNSRYVRAARNEVVRPPRFGVWSWPRSQGLAPNRPGGASRWELGNRLGRRLGAWNTQANLGRDLGRDLYRGGDLAVRSEARTPSTTCSAGSRRPSTTP